MKKCVMMVAALFVFVVNPMIVMSGCGVCTGGGPQYSYNESDLAREVQKVPTTQTIALPDETSLEVTFVIDMESLREDVQRRLELYAFREELARDWMQTAQACSYAIGKEVNFQAQVDIDRFTSDGEREALVSGRTIEGQYAVGDTSLRGGRLVLAAGYIYTPQNNEVYLSYQTPEDGDASRATLVSVYMKDPPISYSSVGEYGFDQPDMAETTLLPD